MSRPANLPSLVRAKFEAAQKTGDLTYYPTKISVVNFRGLSFQVRFSPALANKPKAPKDPKAKAIDVFEDPKKLLVTDWLPGHNLVLNKFAINAYHSILATKKFEEQTHLLEEDDIAAVQACIQAYKEQGEELFAFFNGGGQHSGYSQARRHIQFLPVSSIKNGITDGQSWNVLVDRLVAEDKPDLPFKYFAAKLDAGTSSKQIHHLYLDLYARALRAVEQYNSEAVAPESRQPTMARISYNMAITDAALVLCPRLAEGGDISDRDGNIIGSVSLNGTILAGTILVKSEAEFHALSTNDDDILNHILSKIGVPNNQESR